MYNHPSFDLLFCGNLTEPFNAMAKFTCCAFALVDYYDQFIGQQKDFAVWDAASYILHKHIKDCFFLPSTSI